MPVQTKRKVSTKKETMSVKNERLRLRHWVMFWVLVAATHALVISIFSNVDVRTLLPVSAINEEKMTAEEQLVAELRAQVKSLEDRVASTEGSSDEVSELTLSSPKHPGEPFDIENDACLVDDLSKASIDTYINFKDPKTSVSMDLPYSFSWGTINCPPVTAGGNTAAAFGLQTGPSYFEFGPSHTAQQAWARREASINISPATSTVAIAKQINDSQFFSNVMDLRQRTINGLTVYDFQAGPETTYHNWIAVGRNYTYHILSFGWLKDAEAIKIIQSLRVTK